MKKPLMILATCLFALSAIAATKSDFSGSWKFAPKESKNIGMMSGMSMTSTVTQTAENITVTYEVMGGQNDRTIQRFDLTGKAVDNPTQMGGRAETTSRWAAAELVTTWTSEGAVAGTKVTRTETWSVSPDGKLLTITSVRGQNAPVVMVFERRQ